MARTMRISTRNATFQQWQALLTNRNKRQRAGEFLVQGVRPISLAVERGWEIRAMLVSDGPGLSRWGRDIVDIAGAPQAVVAAELMRELGGKDDEAPELLAVVAMPDDDLARIVAAPAMLVVVFDRPTTPGNIGTLVRSADAFGAAGVIVAGHAADPYDPKAVRASTGSLFALPVVRVPSHVEVLDWVKVVRTDGVPVQIVGADEHGPVEIAEHDLTGPTVLAIGNETHGLSAAWRDACDETVRIPITGAASSLNAASAGSVALYEAARQRRIPG
ncbi:TrmH family RNA methyltransferase [Actinoplanes sp. NPDC049118]|uniref:TrmH family RNA methyltransferase n=1 Tax=Actinoplanes sp. NPDC049118 TaxID=3155769 RepID=UPI00340F829A